MVANGNLAAGIRQFVAYAAKLKGYEKGEAQLFLEHLFQAYGHKNLADTGAFLEHRVISESGVKFADLVWPSRVLIEMKTKGTRLERSHLQAFEYWTYLTPNRPSWVILCNFDEFWVYNFNKQVEEPLEKVPLEELHKHFESLSFLKPEEEEPIFSENRIEVTQAAADLIATIFNSMCGRKIDRDQAQRFVLQCVVAKFSEDINLLPNHLFTRILKECLDHKDPPAHAFDLLSGMFRQMNNPKPAPGGRFKGIRYFNGGIFSDVNPVLMNRFELDGLHRASQQDWSKVNPGIFGTIFQQSMDKDMRHAYGVHFTREADILNVVNPTIVRPFKERMAKAKTFKDLMALRKEVLEFKVLDPACGSGNFLYVAFRELKRIEIELIVTIRRRFKSKLAQSLSQGFLSVHQFYGFDTLKFAVELAKVTLLFAKEMGLAECETAVRNEGEEWMDFDPALPLDNLDANIKAVDALFTEWPKADAIIGNPPFQSKNKMKTELGIQYVDSIRSRFPDIPGRADYCVYFFHKAHSQLKKSGRAGLVGTNTIRQNYSREGGLDYIVANNGTITEAVSTQAWSGDAAVHVSIVNWMKGSEPGKKRLSSQSEDGSWSMVELDTINSSLSFGIDVSGAKSLQANQDAAYCAQGQTHGHEGFLLSPEEAQTMLSPKSRNTDVLFPFITGDDMLGEADGQPTRYVIDFHPRTLFEAQAYSAPFEIVKKKVLPTRKKTAQEEEERNNEVLKGNAKAKVNRHHTNFLSKWWQLSYPRQELIKTLAQIPRYICCARVTKRPIFEFISSGIRPNDALAVFPFADDYSFGILQSNFHWEWFTARCSTLEERFRYTSDTVFDSFPWPQKPTSQQIASVAKCAVKLREVRRQVIKANQWSLRELYRANEQPGKNPLKVAQKALDASVAEAYGAEGASNSLAFLLDLNSRLAKLESEGIGIAGPGFPSQAGNGKSFVTQDCIKMSSL